MFVASARSLALRRGATVASLARAYLSPAPARRCTLPAIRSPSVPVVVGLGTPTWTLTTTGSWSASAYGTVRAPPPLFRGRLALSVTTARGAVSMRCLAEHSQLATVVWLLAGRFGRRRCRTCGCLAWPALLSSEIWAGWCVRVRRAGRRAPRAALTTGRRRRCTSARRRTLGLLMMLETLRAPLRACWAGEAPLTWRTTRLSLMRLTTRSTWILGRRPMSRHRVIGTGVGALPTLQCAPIRRWTSLVRTTLRTTLLHGRAETPVRREPSPGTGGRRRRRRRGRCIVVNAAS